MRSLVTQAPIFDRPRTSCWRRASAESWYRAGHRPAGGLRSICASAVGLAAQFGIGIVNAPGTIDAGYRGRGEGLPLINHDLTA